MKKIYQRFILSAFVALCATASFAQEQLVVEYESSPPPNSIIAILIGLFTPDDFDFNSDGKRDIIARVGNNLVVRTFSQPDNMVLMASEAGISLDDYRCLGFHDIGGGPEKEMVLVPKQGMTGDVIACSLNSSNHFVPSLGFDLSSPYLAGVTNTDGDAQSEILVVMPGEQFYVLGQGFTPGLTGDNPTEKFKNEKPSEKVMGLNFQLQYVAPPNFRWPGNYTYVEPSSQDFNYDNINEYGYLKIEGIDGESKVISGANHEVLDSSPVPIELFSLNFTSMSYFDVTGEGFKHVMIGGSNSGSGLRDMEIILWLNPQTNEINTSLMPFLEQGFRVVAIGNSNGMGGMMNVSIVMSHMNTGRVIVVGDGPGFQGGGTNALIEPKLPDADGALAYTLNMVYESEVPVQLFMPTKGLYGGAELDVNTDGLVDLPYLVLQDSVGNDMAGFTVLDGATFQPIWETTVPAGPIDPAPFFHGFFDANGDGQKEIIYGAETVQTSDSEIHKPFGPGFEIKFIYDLDGDGFEEIIGSTPAGKVQVWSSNEFVSSAFEQQVQAVMGLQVFPNPTTGVVNLKLNQPAVGPVSLRVFDAKGALVHNLDMEQFANTETTLQIELPQQLPNGQYFISVCSSGVCTAGKVLFER
ncbi:MAG: T9SS type A sorting domain-containing protein [Saprospiraceae bacterium]|nr:T9SS type A sorting domain-containing protein [Saprospiraceae bacterium]